MTPLRLGVVIDPVLQTARIKKGVFVSFLKPLRTSELGTEEIIKGSCKGGVLWLFVPAVEGTWTRPSRVGVIDMV